MLEGKHLSFWLRQQESSIFPALKENISTDVLIVGGGLAGVILAYNLQKLGIDFVLCEAQQISTGVTGHSSAKITSLHGLIYDELINRDVKTAQLYAQANQLAIEDYARIIEELKIDCEFKRMPAFTYCTKAEDREKIEKEVKAATELSLPASLEEVDFLPFKTYGAIKFEEQARFDPYKFMLGIAHFLKRSKAKIYENSPVREISYKQNPIEATTDKFKITANRVAVLTNYPIIDPNFYFAKLVPRQSYVLAAESGIDIPLGLYYSTEENFHSFRPHPLNGKEIWFFGSELHIPGREKNTIKRYENLQTWAKNNFKVTKIYNRWTTHDNRSLDNIPIIGRAKKDLPKVFIGTGFKGWGVTNTMAGAKLLADLIAGNKNPFEGLYNPSRTSLLINKKAVSFNIPTVAKLIKENLQSFKGLVSDIKEGEARVIEIGGKKAAVYKDQKGSTHALSAHCRHMGCIVHFNNAEKTWDCPCHASRYTVDGEVIRSPASKPLEKINLQE